jgi:hypothetical protein
VTTPERPAAALSDRELLEEGRDRLRALLREADGREAPALQRELRATLAALRDLSGPAKGSTVDALAARRAARQSSASAS